MPTIETRYSPYAAIIICGRSRSGPLRPSFPFAQEPCYQALSPAGLPDAGLPYFRLEVPDRLLHGEVATLAQFPRISDVCLREILAGIDWVTLITDASVESVALALMIATFARATGKCSTVIYPAAHPLPLSLRAALIDQADSLFSCPENLSFLQAAEAFWSSICCQGPIGVDYADCRTSITAGVGKLIWMPLRDGNDHMREALDSLEPFHATQALWAVLLLPEEDGLAEFILAGECFMGHCSAEATVILATPSVGALPRGIYLAVN